MDAVAAAAARIGEGEVVMGWMSRLAVIAVVVALAVPGAEAQLVYDDFDAYATGAPPPSPWWNWGTSGTMLVDDTVFWGPSGKSVQINRVLFDHQAFAIGQTFPPLVGDTDLTYHFMLAGGSDREALCVFGRDASDNTVAWWVSHGGQFGNAVATYSDSQGWTWIMDIASDTWYGVHLLIDPVSSTYDVTVWQDDNPATTATATDL
ncbi:MAG: hypothetical protein PVG53_10425, partial [Holophagae bacterium]